MKIKFKSNLNRLPKALEEKMKEYEELNNKTVRVGIPDKATNDKGESIVAYAKANEYGVINQNLPARPFMQKSLKAKYVSKNKDVMKRMGRLHKKGDAIRLLEALGMQGVSNIRESIDTEKFAALSPLTIAKKGNDRMLKDSESMYNSFDYEIRKK